MTILISSSFSICCKQIKEEEEVDEDKKSQQVFARYVHAKELT